MSKYPLLITLYLKKERIRHEFLTPEKVQNQHPTLTVKFTQRELVIVIDHADVNTT
ncbi:hypothetical protein Nos7524_0973 [Nostoc sp. PCC 7524]|nr:hypothetical protein Nos7524_0973 [Nostoc sp. PCC 7524]